MDNDKAFAICALVILAALASVITAVMTTGSASMPSPLSFAEHLALSLSFRAAYKGIGGFSWGDWSLLGDRLEPALAAPQSVSRPGITADATS